MGTLLFEIGTEEIPAGFMEAALQQMAQKFCHQTSELRIAHGDVKTYGTPRRMALLVEGLAETQEKISEELLGPSKKAGMDPDGKFTRAAVGFAKSKGVQVEDLKVVETPKGEYLMLVRESGGGETRELLPDILHKLLLELSFPKSMRWGSNKHSFARPIQWIVAMLDKDIIPFEHEGIVTSNRSGGHRFLANKRFEIEHPDSYLDQLKNHHVIADIQSRRQMVVDEVKRSVAEISELQGTQVLIDQGLVDTVTHLVESPYGVCGRFDEKFLQLPDEVLITSMREHQKYFPVADRDGKLVSAFVAVNNTRVNDCQTTVRGHERVLRARLEDALFFYETDRKVSLEERVAKLEGIIFQAKLGTMLEKKDRLVKLVKILASLVDPNLEKQLERAAVLCKADLLTDMVGEFPSLQGTMGMAYALHDGEPQEIATAIAEHYMPKRAGAELPGSMLGALLGLADRFDTLVGCFGIGQIPSGTADPFGLRRISLAILHILEDKQICIALPEIVHKALALYGDKVDGSRETVDRVMSFLKGRFVNDCVRQKIPASVVEAAVRVGFEEVNDCKMRIDAIDQVRKDPAFPVLAGSYKRIRNIIKDNGETEVKPELLHEPSERLLYELCNKVRTECGTLIGEKQYLEALKSMLQMKEPVDTFFEEVMVMAEDQALRQNRLNLLTSLGEIILAVGDISVVQEN